MSASGFEAALPAAAPESGEQDAVMRAFVLFADALHEAALLLDPQGWVRAANHRACEMFGWGTEAGIGNHVGAVLARQGNGFFEGQNLPANAAGFAATARRSDGNSFQAEVNVKPLPGSSAGFRLALVRDVTEREAALTALRESEHTFRALFDANSDALFVHDQTGRIMMVNERMCAMFDCTPEAATELSAIELSANVPPYTEKEAVEHVQRAVREGSCVFDWRFRRLSGELFWSEVALRSFTLRGQPRVIACVREISRRKTMEEELRASEERFAKIFHNISTMLAFTEPEHGRILDVNEAWLRLTGFKRENVVGKTGHELGLWTDERDREVVVEGLAKQGRVLDYETYLHMGPNTLPVLLSADLVQLHGREYVLWEIRDLSERKRVEAERERLRAQLVQSQRMESIGQLAGGVAHDFNNLLTVINGCSYLLLRDLPTTDKHWGLLSDIQRAGERAAALTQQLLAFSRQQVMQPRALDLNALVSETERLLRRLIGEDIDFGVAFEPGLAQVCADPTLITQLVINLVVNARDAMSDGGRLMIEIRNVQVDRVPLEWPSRPKPGPFVRLRVSDTGVGMDEATQRRIFEPFFTTKPRGKGSGLGLSTVYGIVEQTGGFIGVDSKLGVGSTFDVYLPALVESIPAADVRRARPASERGSETILLVEDQSEVRRLVLHLLTGLGYNVLEAGSGDEALSVIAAHPGRVDLLLTDVVMPGMSGRVLSEKLRGSHPTLKVLFMSGYTDDMVVHHGVLDHDIAFLQKPFSPEELSQKVRAVLGTHPRQARSRVDD